MFGSVANKMSGSVGCYSEADRRHVDLISTGAPIRDFNLHNFLIENGNRGDN